jgi:hypothetical protein
MSRTLSSTKINFTPMIYSNNRGCCKSQNPLTPDTSIGAGSKVAKLLREAHKEFNINALSLCASRCPYSALRLKKTFSTAPGTIVNTGNCKTKLFYKT